jgi:acyl-CoA synthetase (NDP forming)
LNDISSLLEPQSVAVIGASSNPEKSGHVLLKSIIVNRYEGKIYPINPNADEILGYKAYKNILDVPGTIDLVFFLLPGQYIEDLFEHCKQKGVKAAVIVAAGFAETGEEGAQAEVKLRKLIQESGIRCIGPNTIGFINMQANLVASFVLFTNWQDGPIARPSCPVGHLWRCRGRPADGPHRPTNGDLQKRCFREQDRSG